MLGFNQNNLFTIFLACLTFISLGLLFASAANLPTVGSDTDTWGTILNAFLLTEHQTDGSHGNVTSASMNITGDTFLGTQGLASCAGKLITSANGNVTCGTDQTGVSDLSDYPTKNESNLFSQTQNFSGGIVLGTTSTTENGTIRWTGLDYEGFNGSEWVSITTNRVASGISPAFSVTKNESQDFNPSVWTKINFSEVTFDSNNDYDVANEWFKPTVPGKYLLTATIWFNAMDQSDWLKISIYKNGEEVMQHGYDSDYLQISPTITLTNVFDADGLNDYFEIYLWHNVVGAQTVFGGEADYKKRTFFSGSRIDGGNGLWTPNGNIISYSAGNVGIGTRTPSKIFEVSGETNITGCMYIANSTLQVNATDLSASGNILSNGNLTIAADNLLRLLQNTTSIPCDSVTDGSFMRSSDNIPYYCNSTDWNALY